MGYSGLLVGRVTKEANPHGQEAFELLAFTQGMYRFFRQAQEDYIDKGLFGGILSNKAGLKTIVACQNYLLGDGRVRKVVVCWPLAEWQTQDQMILLRATQKGGRDGPLEYFLAPTPSGINAHPEFSNKDELAQAIISTIISLEASAGWERCEITAPQLMATLKERHVK